MIECQHQTWADRLIRIQQVSGLEVQEIADILGVHPNQTWRIRTGVVTVPHQSTRRAIEELEAEWFEEL